MKFDLNALSEELNDYLDLGNGTIKGWTTEEITERTGIMMDC